VVDDITVDPNSIGATNAGEKVDEAKKQVAETAKDKLIEGKIQSKLVVAGISGATVDVQNGEVVLKGAVKTQAQKTEAEDLARNTDGVTKVTNDLSVGRA
jgi:osmotically-inducible protein OsmY